MTLKFFLRKLFICWLLPGLFRGGTAFMVAESCRSRVFSSSSLCKATLSPGDGLRSPSQSKEKITEEMREEVKRRSYVWFVPPAVSAAAFVSYDSTAKLFHKCIDAASGHTWQPADGGKYISQLAQTALSGPVTFSVSILFGTLVGITISTLHQRQTAMRNLFVQLHQEGQELKQFLDECSSDIAKESLEELARFMNRIDATMRVPDRSTGDALRRSDELYQLTKFFHRRGNEVDAAILSQIHASLGRLKSYRGELWSAYSNTLSDAHHTVMVLLAASLLFIFLLQTDNDSMQFLIDFQLSICWALLNGAYSLLAAVIVDLHGIPPQLTMSLDHEAVLEDLP